MTQAELIALSNTNISDSTLIVPLKHREVNDEIIKATVGLVVNDTQLTTNILTVNPPTSSIDWEYDVNFLKQGGIIFFWGKIRDSLGSTLYNVDIATISNAEYLPAEETVLIGTSTAGNRLNISFVGDKIKLNGVLLTSNTMEFNGFYPALN